MTEGSSALISASILEHSYCVTTSGAGKVPAEETTGIRDLFGTDTEIEELCGTSGLNRLCSPIRFGDVNLDGFNYAVPTGTSDEVESIWNGVSDLTGNASIIEIAVTDGDNSGFNLINEKGRDGYKDKLGRRRSVGHRRRRDFIQDAAKRSNYFMSSYRKLIADFNRVCSRTGSTGSLSAIFEGKYYDTDTYAPGKEEVGTEEPSNMSVDEETSNCTGETDDHRYAAPMLTQNVKSTSVRDHQYDEKSIQPPSSCDSDDEAGLVGKDVKRRINYRSDYIQVRWMRTQIFTKIVKTLFRHKIILEERTRAQIKLLVKYEGNVIDDLNFEYATKTISDRRQQLKSTHFKLAPQQSIQPQMIRPIISDSTQMPITLIFPSAETVPAFTKNTLNLDIPLITSPAANQQQSPEQLASQCYEAADVYEDNFHLSNAHNQDAVQVVNPADETVEVNISSSGLPGQTETVNAETNTEPICSICYNLRGQVKPFWIRCNDPFCYYIVHAACLGFAVNHSSYLKMLPGFYCETHR